MMPGHERQARAGHGRSAQDFKYFGKILPLLDRLHDPAPPATGPATAILHFDQYIALQLLFFFNPIITSLRGLVQASHLRKVQKELDVFADQPGQLSARPAASLTPVCSSRSLPNWAATAAADA